MKNYRFSIAWTRIYPNGTGEINPKGVEFYNKFLDSLELLGIEPLVTLYHWDLPQALQEYGGWINETVIDAYVTYVDTCFKLFGDRVSEPYTIFFSYIIYFQLYLSGHFHKQNIQNATWETSCVCRERNGKN